MMCGDKYKLPADWHVATYTAKNSGEETLHALPGNCSVAIIVHVYMLHVHLFTAEIGS